MNENMSIILPQNYVISNREIDNNRCVIVIHLYYLDTIEYYLKYINNIPKEILVIFTYSNISVKKRIEKLVGDRNNTVFLYKENRGRDISAFLVAAREYLFQYDYVCFLHDKKEKTDIYKSDTLKWIDSLWENMIGSKQYIQNILFNFEYNEKLGILVPPPFLSERNKQAYTNQWGNNFDNLTGLLERIDAFIDVDKNCSPMSLGTVFWAKTEAIRKLINYPWKYEDFQDEPLPDDGTISHAIERSFEYIALNSGFETKWVMTDQYACDYMNRMTEGLEVAYRVLNKNLGIEFIGEAKSFYERGDKIVQFIKGNKRTFIYGNGCYGKSCQKMIKSRNEKIDGFLVSKKSDQHDGEGVAIYEFDKIKLENNDGIIIAVSYKYKDEVLELIKRTNRQIKVCIYERF